MASEGFGGGAAEGFLAARQLGVNERLGTQRNDILQQQADTQQQQQAVAMANDAIAKTYKAFDDIVKTTLAENKPGARDTLAEIMETLIGGPLANNDMIQQLGLPDRSAQIRAKMNAILSQPTPQELAEQEVSRKVNEKFRIKQAESLAEAEIDQLRVLSGLDGPAKASVIQLIELANDSTASPGEREDAQQALQTRGSQLGFTATFNPDTREFSVSQGPVGAGEQPVLPGKPGASGATLAKLSAQEEAVVDVLDTIENITDKMITNPELFGAPGSIKATADDISGVLEDIANFTLKELGLDTDIGKSIAQHAEKIGVLVKEEPTDPDSIFASSNDIEKAFVRPLTKPNAGTIDVLETTLKFSVLEAMTGGRRPLKVQIEEVNELVQLRGLTSQDRIAGRMQQLRERFLSKEVSIQRQQEGAITGKKTTPRLNTESGAPPEQSRPRQANQIDLDRGRQAIDEILKGKK